MKNLFWRGSASKFGRLNFLHSWRRNPQDLSERETEDECKKKKRVFWETHPSVCELRPGWGRGWRIPRSSAWRGAGAPIWAGASCVHVFVAPDRQTQLIFWHKILFHFAQSHTITKTIENHFSNFFFANFAAWRNSSEPVQFAQHLSHRWRASLGEKCSSVWQLGGSRCITTCFLAADFARRTQGGWLKSGGL